MQVSTRHVRVGLVSALLAALASGAPAADLVVHEWGTITTIHDADGTLATGLNRIDESEVLPEFVHRYEPATTRQPKRLLAKSPRVPGRPDVTMRLETPVIYFHPPPGKPYTASFDVKVRFRGGVLNEFYPDGEASVELDRERIADKTEANIITEWNGDVLNNYVVGTLSWKGVRLHDTVVAPLTNNPIWLAPREVQAASVFLPQAGEGERYLFYRGVAHLDALLQTTLTRSHLQLRTPAQLPWLEAPAVVANIWFAEVRADGLIAFREQPSVTLRKEEAGKQLAQIKRFSGGDFTDARAAQLRGSLKQALLTQGLFADEAEAMLNTWKASYFQKPGLRVFYIVPRAWTDHFLPLELSVPARVNRVMVGRIDLGN
jgi:hypothetical protein